jgi:SAM-dependent methyltransferase
MDAIAQMKETARESWASFVPFEVFTGSVAPQLVRFAGIGPGQKLLDVGCGTGVVALTAVRAGAAVVGADLAPALLERARDHAELARLEVAFEEADVECLPFADASFDVVVSQFGHIFGPRPELTVAEMLRVLKPGGTLAFSTWPPELFIGQMFSLVGQYSPPAPDGVRPPGEWGEPALVRERLGERVRELCFDRGCLRLPSLSPAHARAFLEQNAAPVAKIVKALAADPEPLAQFRRALDGLIERYFEDNVVRQDFLMSRAVKC